jgi:signal transduction histidine kinase
VKLIRPTLRIRMALLYGGLVLLVGVALVLICVILVNASIPNTGIYQHLQGTVTVQDSSGQVYHGSAADLIGQRRQDLRWYVIKNGAVYFAIVVIVATLGAYFLAKSALRPIARVTKTAQQLSTETLDQRIALGGPDDELRELADTFDEMLGRLDAAFESQRMFVANASHELRTPLSVIRTELDVTLADPNASVTELRHMGEVARVATDRAQRLVGSLLTLARLQAGVRGELEAQEHVDLATLVPMALAAVEIEAQERSIAIEERLEPADTVGDPRLLERLIGNLVENAVHHNRAGGWLHITTGTRNGNAWLHVANSGAVISPSEVGSLFEAFRRGGSRRRTAMRGAGLGLSIVKLIVDAHHGTLHAAAPPFGGLSIRVELQQSQFVRGAHRSAEHATPQSETAVAPLDVNSAADPAVPTRGGG